MAVVNKTELATVYSAGYAITQEGWDPFGHEQTVTVPSGGVILSASVVFSAGQGVDYSYLTGMESGGSDTWSFYLKRHRGETYYANLHVMYEDGN